MSNIDYRIEPEVSDDALNALFSTAWPQHTPVQFHPILSRSLTYLCASDGSVLVGFVNVAWDGGLHGFILDTTVHAEYQRTGIGTELLRIAADVARARGLEWLHVDYEPHHDAFYRGCGYRETMAGLLHLTDNPLLEV